ncbi:hypothetical protein ACFSC6_07800 [Rufibacter sediminis]|uniref:Tetratricopeptide repeat protein n=1 Tax=Rufibacter sediminis TaxID=2762756 RepID=A0ABR6VQ07_9BACT|nr:hypothetical protein [Rufibacter sediminis]MBC3539245.1 hypothetical protein [Rufibacter sediminis]
MDTNTSVFAVTNADNDDELEWIIEPTDFMLLPEEENTYFVKAKQVYTDRTIDCFIGIMTPERIAETVIKKNKDGHAAVAESIYEQENSVIPAVASNCFGDYTLYYSKENPQIGIDILIGGLYNATNKNTVAEDLGYILRDENRVEEAIEAFKISEEVGPSSEYVYLELSRLYKRLGMTKKQSEYERKFKKKGGIE